MFFASDFLSAKSNPLNLIIIGSPNGATFFTSISVLSIQPKASSLLTNLSLPLILSIRPFDQFLNHKQSSFIPPNEIHYH